MVPGLNLKELYTIVSRNMEQPLLIYHGLSAMHLLPTQSPIKLHTRSSTMEDLVHPRAKLFPTKLVKERAITFLDDISNSCAINTIEYFIAFSY